MTGKVPKEREHYFIRLDTGEACEVNREVYHCYYAGIRQERYQKELERKYGVVSIEAVTSSLPDGGRGYDFIPSGEEDIAEQVNKKMMIEKLRAALKKLKPEDRRLIQALYYDNVGVRSYARENGITHRCVQKRRDKILAQLRKMLE